MKNYESNNITHYPYTSIPSLKNLTEYLTIVTENEKDCTKRWVKEIKNDNIESSKYFNSINHHLIITPFISTYILPYDLQNIINEIEPIDNLWCNNETLENFKYRELNIRKFFDNWMDAIMKVNLLTKNDKINNELINF
jgi:hypothetical protein